METGPLAKDPAEGIFDPQHLGGDDYVPEFEEFDRSKIGSMAKEAAAAAAAATEGKAAPRDEL